MPIYSLALTSPFNVNVRISISIPVWDDRDSFLRIEKPFRVAIYSGY